jgi:hypothetical protein
MRKPKDDKATKIRCAICNRGPLYPLASCVPGEPVICIKCSFAYKMDAEQIINAIQAAN